MSDVDLSQFHQVFFEETAEHLSTLESLLLDFDFANTDDDTLNAIFRAVHSIKGSAATFGFMDLSETAHTLENVLDRIRQHTLTPTPEMINLFLECRDVLESLLNYHQNGDDEVDKGLIEDVCQRLKNINEINEINENNENKNLSNNSNFHEKSEKISEKPTQKISKIFEISFTPTEDAIKNNAVESLFSDLQEFGVVENIQNDADQYQVNFSLKTAATPQDFGGWIEFIAKENSLKITEQISDLADDPDGAFGFFTDDSENKENNDNDDPDGAFGFFEPLSEINAKKNSANLVENVQNNADDDPDGAFGFFEPLNKNTPTETKVTPQASITTTNVVAKKITQKKATNVDNSIRVSTNKVDQLINLVSELVITQSMLLQIVNNKNENGVINNDDLLDGLSQLERNSRDLQEAVMSIRMLPVSFVFSRFPRVVHDTSLKLGKKVELKIFGENTEIDKGMIEKLSDPLTHLIRNSLDHGIELPSERIAKNKPEVGTICLTASQQGGAIMIEIADDGGGLNREKILKKAKEKNIKIADDASDKEVFALICEAGFSTAEKVTDVSGRGVGMDVVRKNLQILGGRLDIDSVKDKGTTMTIFLPLTLAILDGMSVQIGKEIYILPLSSILESLQISHENIKTVSQENILVKVRNEYLPLVHLSQIFKNSDHTNKNYKNLATTDLENGIMVVINSGHKKIALYVDALLGQHQVVIKSLEANYHAVKGISGATILGDGQVAMILDTHAIIELTNWQENL